MSNIQNNISLKPYNTFGIDETAKRFCTIQSAEQLQQLITDGEQDFFMLGGGSNLLLTQPVEQLVLKNEILGKEIVDETDATVTIAFGGGENWHESVLWAVENNYGGIENLSLIPGTIGAAPIQNIGAYGVELKDIFVKLEAIHTETGKQRIFTKEDCAFGYRNSVFKHELKGQYFITKVYLELTKKRHHQINTSYGAIVAVLEEKNIQKPTIQDISDAVIQIRSSKLPDPKKFGNSGSFFKNPIISKDYFEEMQSFFPSIVAYPQADGNVKVPAGWLIEKCGWKGKMVGNVACYAHQALVIVNLGNATGKEVLEHAKRIIDSVDNTFGIQLEPEVNIM